MPETTFVSVRRPPARAPALSRASLCVRAPQKRPQKLTDSSVGTSRAVSANYDGFDGLSFVDKK